MRSFSPALLGLGYALLAACVDGTGTLLDTTDAGGTNDGGVVMPADGGTEEPPAQAERELVVVTGRRAEDGAQERYLVQLGDQRFAAEPLDLPGVSADQAARLFMGPLGDFLVYNSADRLRVAALEAGRLGELSLDIPDVPGSARAWASTGDRFVVSRFGGDFSVVRVAPPRRWAHDDLDATAVAGWSEDGEWVALHTRRGVATLGLTRNQRIPPIASDSQEAATWAGNDLLVVDNGVLTGWSFDAAWLDADPWPNPEGTFVQPFLRRANVSPDGRYVVFARSARDGERSVWVLDRRNETTVSAGRLDSRLDGVFWRPQGAGAVIRTVGASWYALQPDASQGWRSTPIRLPASSDETLRIRVGFVDDRHAAIYRGLALDVVDTAVTPPTVERLYEGEPGALPSPVLTWGHGLVHGLGPRSLSVLRRDGTRRALRIGEGSELQVMGPAYLSRNGRWLIVAVLRDRETRDVHIVDLETGSDDISDAPVLASGVSAVAIASADQRIPWD